MRILIEALGINRPGGGRTATMNLLRPLLSIDHRNEYVIVLSAPERSLMGLSPRASQYVVPIRSRFASRLFLQAMLPFICRRRRIDVVHFVKNQTVLTAGVKSIVTVYDLTTLRHPEAYPAVDVWYWRNILPRQYRKMDRVIAISEATAADLVSRYRLPRERIRVIHCAYDPIYRPVQPQQIGHSRQALGLDGIEYFVHVGNLSLKKNLAVLVEAFLEFKNRTGFSGKLVLAGAHYSKGRDVRFFEVLARPEARAAVLLTGPVPQEELPGLYGGALAFLFPSLHEGFGLAPLEAMACGTPVVAYGGAAVSEVVGEAGILLASATDVGEWSRALERVANDPSLRERLRQAGLVRAAQFGGERAARQTLQLYEEMAPASVRELEKEPHSVPSVH